MEIRKLYGHAALPFSGHHWRASTRQECDLVLPVGGQVVPIEIKHTARPGKHDLAGLRSFIQAYGPLVAGGLLISMDPEVRLVTPRIYNLPLGLLLRGP